VATGGGRGHRSAVVELRSLIGVGPVLAPPGHQIRGATQVPGPVVLATGSGPLTVEPLSDRLAVTGTC
jgi:hypothetical protein